MNVAKENSLCGGIFDGAQYRLINGPKIDDKEPIEGMVLAVLVNIGAFFQKKHHHDLTFHQMSFDRGGNKKHQR